MIHLFRKIPRKKIIMYAAAGALLILAGGIFIPFTTHKAYLAVETITTREPYDSASPEKYTKENKIFIAADYYIGYARCINYIYNPPSNCGLSIENADVISGQFKIEFNLTMEKGREFTRNDTLYIAAGKTKKLSFTVNEKVRRFTYFITPPLKEGVEYIDSHDPHAISQCRNEQEAGRTVTYCTIKKIRKVMKLKEIKLSLAKRLFI
jgi:hypothetical protein